MSQQPIVDIVCTNRGQHPSRRLTRLLDRRSRPVADPVHGSLTFLPEDSTRPRPSADSRYVGGYFPVESHRETWESFCPTCGRNTQMRSDTLGRVVDALATHGRPAVVDISKLPF